MREPHEPNFYAFVTYGLRRQGLLTEAVAEVPRAELALQQPPKVAQETGAPLCLIDCMFTLAQAGDYAAALALADRLSKIDDPNLQAMRAMCHVAAGQPDPARVALGKPAVTTGAASYVREPARRAIYDHAIAAVALLTAPGQPVAEAAIDVALAAIERAWPVYPERNWFKTDPNLVAIREHPRFLALR